MSFYYINVETKIYIFFQIWKKITSRAKECLKEQEIRAKIVSEGANLHYLWLAGHGGCVRCLRLIGRWEGAIIEALWRVGGWECWRFGGLGLVGSVVTQLPQYCVALLLNWVCTHEHLISNKKKILTLLKNCLLSPLRNYMWHTEWLHLEKKNLHQIHLYNLS